jgi:hypothetical protein
MPAAMLAIRLFAARTRGPVRIQDDPVLAQQLISADRHVLVYDVPAEGRRAHRIELEQPHLFSRQAELREPVENNDPELRMEGNLERIGGHYTGPTVFDGKMFSEPILVQRKRGCNLKSPLRA